MPLLAADKSALLPSEQAAEAQQLGLRRMSDQLDLNGATEIERGWNSAGLGERANALYTQAAHAYNKGDMRGGEALEMQARDIDKQTQQWAPTVQNLTDVRGLRSGMDWFAGALGNTRTSVAPAVGSLGGAGVGAGIGMLAGPVGAAAGLRAGSYLGGAIAGYNSEANEAIANAMRDPTIRASRSMQDIIDTGRVKGVANSALEAAVPAMTVNRIFGEGAKKLVKGEALKHVGKEVAKGGTGEFGTEGTQSLVGQGAENYLKNKDLTDFDYKQAFNEGAAGAVAGGGMGVVGGGAQVLHGKVQDTTDNVKGKIDEVKSDPVGKVVDGIVAAGGALGTGKAKLESWFEQANSEPHRARDTLVHPERYPQSADERKATAMSWAEHVLTNPNDFDEQDRKDAQQFVQTGNADLYRDKLTISHHEKRLNTTDEGITSEIDERLGKGSKASQMRASDRMHIESAAFEHDKSPKQLETVADIWRKQGVNEKLLKATSDKTDVSQRRMAISVLGWISNGFKDVDGELFVPDNFTSAYGENSPKMIRKAAELALLHGIVSPEDFSKLGEVEKMAQLQHAENTASYDAVVGNMTEAAKAKYGSAAEEFIPEMRRMAEHGMTKKEEGFLLRLYGSQEKISAAMSKFNIKANNRSNLITEEDTHESLNSSPVDEDGNMRESDDLTYEDKQSIGGELATSDRSSTQFYSKDGTYFDTKDELHRKVLNEKQARFGGSSQEDKQTKQVTLVGKFDHKIELAQEAAHAERLGVDVDALTDAERADAHEVPLHHSKVGKIKRELISEHHPATDVRTTVGKKATLAERAEFEVNNKGDKARRKVDWLVRQINNRFKALRVTETSSAALGTEFDMEDVKALSLEAATGQQSKGNEILSTGKLFLKRNGATKPITISAPMLIARFGSKVRDGSGMSTNDSGGTAAWRYEQLMQALTSLFNVSKRDGEPYFTGEIGYVMKPGGAFTWLNKGALGQIPEDLPLDGERKYFLGDALHQMKVKRQTQSDSVYAINYAETEAEKFAAIEEFIGRWIKNGEIVPEKTKGAYPLVSKADREEASNFDSINAIYEFFKPDGDSGGELLNQASSVGDKPTGSNVDREELSKLRRWLRKAEGLKVGDGETRSDVTISTRPDAQTKRVLVSDKVMAGELTLLLKKEGSTLTKEQRAEILAALKDGDVVRPYEKYIGAQHRTMFIERKEKDIVPSENTKTGDIAVGGEHPWNDTLLAEGPKGEIHRDETTGVQKGIGLDAEGMALGGNSRGTPNGKAVGKTKSDTFEATNVVTDDFGNELKVRGKRVETGKGEVLPSRGPNESTEAPLATKTVDSEVKPVTAKQLAALEKIEGAKEWVVSMLANAEKFGEMINKVKTMSGAQVEILTHALFGKTDVKTSPTYKTVTEGVDNKGRPLRKRGSEGLKWALAQGGEHTTTPHETGLLDLSGEQFAKLYFPNNEGKGRMRLTRLKNYADTIASALNARKQEVVNGKTGRSSEEKPSAQLEKSSGETARGTDSHGAGSDRADKSKDAEQPKSLLDRTREEFNGLKSTRDKINFLFNELKDTLDDTEYTIFGYRFTYDKNQSQYELAQYLEFLSDTVRKMEGQMSPKQATALSEMSTKAYRAFKVWAGDKHVVDVLESGEKRSPEHILEAVDKTFAKNLINENFDKLLGDSVDSVMSFAQKVADISTAWSEVRANDDLFDKFYELGYAAEQIVGEAQRELSGKNTWSSTDYNSYFEGIEHTDADVQKFIETLAGGKSSAAKAEYGKRATPEEVEAARQHVLNTVDIEPIFKNFFRDNSSGSWTPRAKKNLIKLALNSDVLGTAYHESMHEFVSMLRKRGADNVVDLLKRVGSNQIVVKQLQRLLKDHEAAIQQLNDPDEVVAYAYQFWRAGKLNLGPQTKTFFQKVKDAFNKLFGKVSAEVKDAEMAEKILAAFSAGAVKDTGVRDAIINAMNSDVAQHDARIEAVGKSANAAVNAVGNVLFSAEAMMELTGSKHMVEIARGFNQKAGEGMSHKQAYFDAYKQQLGIWMNKLENIIGNVDKEDLDIAREALATGKATHNPASKKIVEAIREFNEEFYKYFNGRGTKRWDSEAMNAKWGTKGDWVDVPHRENYFPRVWDSSTIIANTQKFKDLLIEHHMPQLTRIAEVANAELQAALTNNGGKMGDVAKAAFDAGSRDVITPEQIADAIVARLANGNGHADLAESISAIGMSPAATAVNKRELDWIDDKHFDEFKQQDLVKIMSSYVTNMVKRAEYTHRFGPGGERLSEKGDMAVLDKLGGDALIKDARAAMPAEVEAWKKAKAAALKAKQPFDTPFPTLRSVGQGVHFGRVGREQGIEDLSNALKDLGSGFRAIMAMEGTLGNDITPGARNLNSVMITYQALRLLPLSLFGSMNDVMGLVVNGGELGDAWSAFTKAMREIKLGWQNKKSTDTDAQRAAIWGTVEATAALDAVGQTYGSMYMTDKAKRISDALFKWNGMEAWNRAMRITATTVAERVIGSYANNGVDMKDEAAAARFERLFGKNFDPKNIKLMPDGSLDTSDPRNQAAVMRWVNDAVMTPNASHRTIWGSDPHFAAFWQLKQFAYTMHRVMLKNAVEQAKLGNYRPVMTMLCGYAPVMIAADAVKEMMIPGDEPPWMKMGLGGYVAHGMDRAGVLGVPQMIFDGFDNDYGASLFGPSVSQIARVPFDDVGKTTLGSLPGGSVLRRAAG